MEKKTIAAAVALVVIAASHGGCFNPDYGAGGFTCARGECPSGYECRNGVCRERGTTANDSSVDAPPPADSMTDGPSPGDTARPDVELADGQPDLPAPDVKPHTDVKPQPDTKPLPDTQPPPDSKPQPDTTQPSVCMRYKVTPSLKISKQPFDLAMDGKTKPHIVFADSAGTLVHASGKPGSWILTKGPIDVDRLAADFENPNTGVDVLHVVYREAGVKSPKLYHTHRNLGIGPVTWAKPVKIPSSPDTFYADVGARASDIFVVAGGYTTFAGGKYGPILNRWQLKPAGTASYTYTSLGNMQSDEFHHVRVDVAKAGWGHTAWIKTSVATFWRTEANGSFTNARSISTANPTTSPAAVALDFKGNYHHAFVRTSGSTDTLFYGFWSGLGGSAVKEQKIFVGDVHPESVDIAVVDGLPYVSYARAGVAPQVYLSRMDTSNTWHHYQIGKTGTKPSPYTRVAPEVGVTGAVTVHAAYLDGGTLAYARCPLP